MRLDSAVSAFILAGGQSSRMGADKAFVELDGKTLLARALDLARSVSPDVSIVGPREKFARFAPVIEDIFPGRGPLAGIHAALRSSPTSLNFVVAVDTPFISAALARYLIAQAGGFPEAQAVLPRSDGYTHLLCALYRRPFGDVAERALLAGKNKIEPLFSEIAVRIVEQDELETAGFSATLFRNLNTPADIEAERFPRKRFARVTPGEPTQGK
ncbi:MAG TPA: molybdenum cofactor guanylyltransferase [Candidatus Binatia bacterium]|nr:molybdenum cofactor guanylyltransferase [Candidatus Binatia bacterium]